MLLTKNGITMELTNPIDVTQYKRLGYVEVKLVEVESQLETPEPIKPAEEKPAEKKAAKNVSRN